MNQFIWLHEERTKRKVLVNSARILIVKPRADDAKGEPLGSTITFSQDADVLLVTETPGQIETLILKQK